MYDIVIKSFVLLLINLIIVLKSNKVKTKMSVCENDDDICETGEEVDEDYTYPIKKDVESDHDDDEYFDEDAPLTVIGYDLAELARFLIDSIKDRSASGSCEIDRDIERLERICRLVKEINIE
jgi:hypothetical protein